MLCAMEVGRICRTQLDHVVVVCVLIGGKQLAGITVAADTAAAAAATAGVDGGWCT